MAEFITESSGRPDDQFLNDLSAAIRLKSFLVGAGREIPKDAAKGLADLVSAFDRDIRIYELQLRYDEWKRTWWRKLSRERVPDEFATVHEIERQLRVEEEVAMRLRDNLRSV